MKYFFSVSLFVFGVLAGYFAFRILVSRERKYMEYRMLALLCVASGIWSLGFGPLLLQTDPDKAYLCRSFGMIGTFLYLIMAQVLVCYISDIRKKWQYYLNGVSYIGIIIYFLVIKKDQTVYYLDDIGMTYYFRKGIINTVYTLYTVIIALGIFCVIVYMLRTSKIKRIKAFGKHFLLVEVLIVFGMILDTIFPMLGKSAIPGSTITQFFGLVVIYRAVYAMNRSRINIQNMSEFIYYSLSMPVLVYDVKQKLHIINDAAAEFLNINQKDIDGNDFSISTLFEVTENDTFDFNGKYKDIDVICINNQIPCNLAVNKIHDSYKDVIGYIIVVTDLSERVKAVQKLEEAKREAEAANLSKSTFLANISHEIRTPMNAIIGLSELVLKMDISPKVREYLTDTKNSSLSLLAIINDILDISKLESGKMELECENYYTTSLFRDVFLMIDTQAKKKGLEFSMDIAPDIPNELFGDKIRIRGILINLLNNSVKYTKTGKVSLSVQMPEKSNGMAKLEMKIADTGVGIKQSEIDYIFESFTQVDKKVHRGTEGTGLGLAIVKGFVELMNGTITVNSVYGEGSVFTVVINQKIIDETPADACLIGEESGDAFSLGNIKISDTRVLIVDDNQVNLNVSKNILEYYGLQVDTATGGEESIGLCRQNQYDIVFMDQMMPQMDGIEAMQEIRKLNAFYDYGGHCKIVVLTANAISGMREQLIRQGFDEYLGKPMNFNQLELLLYKFIPKDRISVENKETYDVKTTEHVSYEQCNQEEQCLSELLPSLDINKGLGYCAGQIETYLSVLKMVYASKETQLSGLQSQYAKKNLKEFTVQIHALKGQLLNIGAGDISNLAKQLEQAGREGNTDYIDDKLQIFVKEYQGLMQELAVVLQKYRLIEEDILSETKHTDLSVLAKNILKSLEEYDFAGISKDIQSFCKADLSVKDKEVFEQILQFSASMELEELQALLEEYLK